MKTTWGLVISIAAVLASPAAFAVDKYPVLPDLEKQNVETFQAQADKVVEDMHKGGRYEYISDKDRKIVEDDLAFMHDLIEKNGTVAAMKEEDKIHLFNRQEIINTLLTRSDGSRIVCEKTDQPGSLFRVTTCSTYADQQRRHRAAEDALRQTQATHAHQFSGAGPG